MSDEPLRLLRPAALRVWIYLEPKLRCGQRRMTQACIADGAGVSVRAVRDATRALDNLGWVTFTNDRTGLARIYRMGQRAPKQETLV